MRLLRATAAVVGLVLVVLVCPRFATASTVVHPWDHIEVGGPVDNGCAGSYFYGDDPIEGLSFTWNGQPIVYGEHGTIVRPDARGEMTLTAKLPAGTSTPDSLTATFVQYAAGGCSPLWDMEGTHSWCANRDWKKNSAVYRSSEYGWGVGREVAISWTLTRWEDNRQLASGQLPLADRSGGGRDRAELVLEQPLKLTKGRYQYHFTQARFPFASHVEIDVVDCAAVVASSTCSSIVLDNSATGVPVTFRYARDNDDNTTARTVSAGRRETVQISSRVDRHHFRWNAEWSTDDPPDRWYPWAGFSRFEERGAVADLDLGLCRIKGSRPVITGKAKVGKTLKAKPGRWKPGSVHLSYQWNRSGHAIRGAKKLTYKLQKADRRARITVTVRGTKASYAPLSSTSKATKKVK